MRNAPPDDAADRFPPLRKKNTTNSAASAAAVAAETENAVLSYIFPEPVRFTCRKLPAAAAAGTAIQVSR